MKYINKKKIHGVLFNIHVHYKCYCYGFGNIHFHHKQMFIFVIISYVDCVYFVWLELEL